MQPNWNSLPYFYEETYSEAFLKHLKPPKFTTTILLCPVNILAETWPLLSEAIDISIRFVYIAKDGQIPRPI